MGTTRLAPLSVIPFDVEAALWRLTPGLRQLPGSIARIADVFTRNAYIGSGDLNLLNGRHAGRMAAGKA